MKRTQSLFIFANLLMVNSAFADGFSMQNGKPTFANSLELQGYVKTIATYKPEAPFLNERLRKTIEYYKHVHILKTVSKETYTVDCIPFAEQPALIDNQKLANKLLPSMISKTQSDIVSLKNIGDNFDFNPAKECPFGSIAMLRPSHKMLTSLAASTKVAPGRNSKNLLAPGYTWQQGATPDGTTIYIPTPIQNQAYFAGPQNQYVNPNEGGDHSLNQFWLTRDLVRQHVEETYSVEFGIMASAYFTTNPSTAIFVFASIDNYGGKSCYDLLCPNFIQAPGTTPIGVPITNLAGDYIFKVVHITTPGAQAGYYLTLIAHNPTGANYTMILGLYPEYLYTPIRLPRQFSAGAEVYADAPGDGTLMYGNYANPYAGYIGEKVISLFSLNGNSFPYSYTQAPPPYGVIWRLGQA